MKKCIVCVQSFKPGHKNQKICSDACKEAQTALVLRKYQVKAFKGLILEMTNVELLEFHSLVNHELMSRSSK